MGLETGTGIGDLVPTNPLSTDAVSAGDDHIRLIKTVMRSITFLKSIQTFTASGTWIRPANVKKILIYCLGGGGGGNGGATDGTAGGGGSSGAIAIKWLDVTGISTDAVTIGAGGAGGAINAVGTNGTFTSFGVYCVAVEGKAGTATRLGGVPHPRALSAGDIIFAGTAGHNGASFAAPSAAGGNGGGAGGNADTAAQPNSGGGGGGGGALASTGFAGAAGGTGYCIIFEFGW